MNRQEILLDIAQTLNCSVKEVPGDFPDKQLNAIFGLAQGTLEVRRSRGEIDIPSYKLGRSRRTPLCAVIQFKLSQISDGGV